MIPVRGQSAHVIFDSPSVHDKGRHRPVNQAEVRVISMVKATMP